MKHRDFLQKADVCVCACAVIFFFFNRSYWHCYFVLKSLAWKFLYCPYLGVRVDAVEKPDFQHSDLMFEAIEPKRI